jgi:hypothetical protein
MDLKNILLKEANRKGMCKQNLRALAKCENERDMIRLYKRTIDWALENDYPNLRILTQYFSNSERYGIYVGKTFHGEKFYRKQCYVFHNCQGVIDVGMDYERAVIPMLYFANDCHITVTSSQQNKRAIRVPLYIFGDNSVTAQSDDNVIFRRFNIDVI